MNRNQLNAALQTIAERKRTEDERDVHLVEFGRDRRMPVPSAMQFTAQDRLIDRSLRFGRGGTGELVLKRELVPLAAICQEAIDQASLEHPGNPIEFERYDDALGKWDRYRLLQVVQNLVSNALSYGDAGEPVVVSVIDRGDEAVLAVANRGQPIPNPVREQLLDPNRRGAWSSDHLGLYIVKEIVRAHGGRIELTSDNIATVFHIWLPKNRDSSLPHAGDHI